MSKNVNNKKCAPKLILFNEKNGKIRIIFKASKVQTRLLVVTFVFFRLHFVSLCIFVNIKSISANGTPSPNQSLFYFKYLVIYNFWVHSFKKSSYSSVKKTSSIQENEFLLWWLVTLTCHWKRNNPFSLLNIIEMDLLTWGST